MNNDQNQNGSTDQGTNRTRLFSLISLAFGIAALACSFTVSPVSAFLGAVGIVNAALARKNLGYYDGISIAGLVLSIIGAAVGLSLFILDKTGVLANLLNG